MTHPDILPSLVYADETGNIRDFPELAMAGSANGSFYRPELSDLIPLPDGSELFTLPDRKPIGTDLLSGEPLLLDKSPEGMDIQAVAAFMAPAHTAVYSAAFQAGDSPVLLPLFAYTAVGWHGGQFWVTGFRSDDDRRQDYQQFKQSLITKKTRSKLSRHQDNRLIQHLGKCCLTYHCPAARNYFLGRWEAPLPTSPSCNARCLGCISLQPSGCCPSTQERLHFVPSVHEIAEIAIPHLEKANRAIVSFGQGCEGEPLLQAPLIERAIRLIRDKTSAGTINLNSNASLPGSVERLARAGLDSIRVSINSAQQMYYNRYYRPVNYTFDDVVASIRTMKKAGKFVSLNYFILPGFSDSHDETEALCSLIEHTGPDFIQLRNLNIDPDWYRKTLEIPEGLERYGIRAWLLRIKKLFPELMFGYYNPFLPDFPHLS
ncbi:MAG: radical SAM protein [Desulfocapsaceae bacterium]|nr:radical SAM protein [Desulfocapsaceae bacterium]